mgnify:CR=1 FL=1
MTITVTPIDSESASTGVDIYVQGGLNPQDMELERKRK